MINFVICEDEKVLATKYKNVIDNFMMNYDTDYKCHLFDGYTKEWKEFAEKDNGFKIYLLDIKTNEGSGLNAARIIREEFDDWTSMIIIITSFNEYKYDALGKRLMLVDFINKLDNPEQYLKSALSICMKNYDNRPKILKYTYKNTIYNLDFKNIVYIEKEMDSKRCTIHTALGEDIIYPGTINKLITELDNRFTKASRSVIINLEQIKNYNTKENKIVFKNGKSTDAISRDMKKGLIRYVRGLN